ncbi:hypothetical protein V1524DRAFT_412279 [Lipomyces starkeyi]
MEWIATLVLRNTRYDALTKEDKLYGFEAWPLIDPDNGDAVEDKEERNEESQQRSSTKPKLRDGRSSSKDDDHGHHGYAHAHPHGVARCTAIRA